jgi:hypothetical protein
MALMGLVGWSGWVMYDYRQWKALGKGGIPYNLKGWWIVQGFKRLAREPFTTDMYLARRDDPEEMSRLEQLPYRQGERPKLGKHPVPHRQITQLPDGALKEQTRQLFDAFVQTHGNDVHYANSFYERHNAAVIVNDLAHAHRIVKSTSGEAAHWHPMDGSMHMIFSANDAKQIIDKGWGERHGLAGVPQHNLPDTYLLIYAPRNAQEMAVVQRLLYAAVNHVGRLGCDCGCGGDIQMDRVA